MRISLLSLCFLSLAGTRAFAQTAYLPDAGKTELSLSYTYETYTEYFNANGTTKLSDLGLDRVTQQSATIFASYGLTPNFAVDVTLGYVGSSTDVSVLPGDPTTINGLDDTRLGLRWRMLSESPDTWLPTFTLRGAVIIAGTYDAGFFNSPGNGGTGGEYGFLFGKYFEPIQAGIYGNFYHRIVSNNVPQQIDFTVGAYKTFFESLTFYAGYRRLQSFGGLDVFGPGFTLDKFSELNEISDSIQGGISYMDGGGRSYGVNVAQILGGENAAETLTLNFSFGLVF